MRRFIAGLVLGLTALVLLALLTGIDARSGGTPRLPQPTLGDQEAGGGAITDPSRHAQPVDLQTILELRRRHGSLLQGTTLEQPDDVDAATDGDLLFLTALERLAEAEPRRPGSAAPAASKD